MFRHMRRNAFPCAPAPAKPAVGPEFHEFPRTRKGEQASWLPLAVRSAAWLLAGWACWQPAVAQETASSLSLEGVVGKVREQVGVCVHLGCGEGALTARLAEGGKLLVHGLEADTAKVGRARQALLARGLYGQVSVEAWSASRLPYADNLVNVIVAQKDAGVPEGELLRTLAPGGTAFLEEGASWRAVSKPWPAAYDSWTHPRHSADGNMVSRDKEVSAPVGVRWVAGPAQDAGGRKWYYDHALVSVDGRNFYMHEDTVTARDAFNGTLRWTRPIKPATYREKGALVPPLLQSKFKQSFRTTRVKPVATKDHLYVAAEGKIMAWDARTGQTVLDYGTVAGPRLMLVTGGRLVVASSNAVQAADLTSPAWRWTQPLEAEQIVASEDAVFCVTREAVVALDLLGGGARWQASRPAPDASATCTYQNGFLAIEESSWRDDGSGCRLMVYSTRDGRLLWQRDHRPGMTHYQETRSFFIRDLILLQSERGKVIGLDPQTGVDKQSWTSRGHHCATPVATEHYFIAPECDFTHLETGARTRARMFKSACRLPFIPANGLLYSFPVQCECYPMLRGYMGLAGSRAPALATRPRFEQGPAFGRNGSAFAGSRAGDWPTYRRDGYRSAATSETLPTNSDLKIEWSAQLARARQALYAADWDDNPFVPGLLSAPVAAGGLVFVAIPGEHRVVALDAKAGQVRWRFVAGGRVDLPPTIDGGLCLFGSHDGWVYCLEAASGELAWRFRAAPSEARMMAYGQMESPWPVPGSVLVDQGTAFVAAGRHPCSEDGVHVLALNTRPGSVLWEKLINEIPLRNWYSPLLPTKKKVGLDFEPVDLMVKDGQGVAMSRWWFDAHTGRSRIQLDSVEYDAGGLPVPRGLWSYGIRQNKSVLTRSPACFGQSYVHLATTNDTAVVLAGQEVIRATQTGLVEGTGRRIQLGAPVVHDGMIVAGGRLYAAAGDGRLVCLR
jgi:outer membrane protein assembly factor BamB